MNNILCLLSLHDFVDIQTWPLRPIRQCRRCGARYILAAQDPYSGIIWERIEQLARAQAGAKEG
jgi:hypothetical protein